MKVKTSITLSKETLRAVDRLGSNRSQVIEQAIRAFVAMRERQARDARDIELINRHADELNREIADALKYQVKL